MEEVKDSHTLGGTGEWDTLGEGSGHVRDEKLECGRGECVCEGIGESSMSQV